MAGDAIGTLFKAGDTLKNACDELDELRGMADVTRAICKELESQLRGFRPSAEADHLVQLLLTKSSEMRSITNSVPSSQRSVGNQEARRNTSRPGRAERRNQVHNRLTHAARELRALSSDPAGKKRRLSRLYTELTAILAILTNQEVLRISKELTAAKGLIESLTATDKQKHDDKNQQEDRWVVAYSNLKDVTRSVIEDNLSNISKLRNAVCEGAKSRSPPPQTAPTVAVYGEGGVGKTLACAVVASDRDIRKEFPGGVHSMQLGIAANTSTVLKQIAYVVRAAGGRKLAGTIALMGEDQLYDAQATARSWFAEKKILMIVDNVFPCDAGMDSGNWISVIAGFVDRSSLMLYSTRSQALAKRATLSLQFERLDPAGPESLSVFCRYLGVSATGDGCFNGERAKDVLEYCHGLPLAICVAASYLKSNGYPWKEAARQFAALRKADADFTPNGKGRSNDLWTVDDLVLNQLDATRHSSVLPLDSPPRTLPIGYWWTDLYLSLAVLQNAAPKISTQVLSLLWSLSLPDTEYICCVFDDLSLASFKSDESPGTLELHDLHVEYCCMRSVGTELHDGRGAKCSKPGCMKADRPFLLVWHERIVQELLMRFGGKADTRNTDDLSRLSTRLVLALCSSSLEENTVLDDYFSEHCIRHVVETVGGVHVAKEMLLDYRCLRKLAQRRGLAAVARDFRAVISAGKQENSFAPELLESLEYISTVLATQIPPEAAKPRKEWADESDVCVIHAERPNGDPGLAHQLVGRLSSRALKDPEGPAAALRRSVCLLASRPWLRPFHGCFGEPGECKRVVRLYGLPRCAGYIDNSRVAVGIDSDVFVYEVETGEAITVLYGEARRAGVSCIGKFVTRTGDISAESGKKKYSCIPVGYDDGRVCMWNLQTCEWDLVLAAKSLGAVSAIRLTSDIKLMMCWFESKKKVRLCSINTRDGSWDIANENYECANLMEFEFRSATRFGAAEHLPPDLEPHTARKISRHCAQVRYGDTQLVVGLVCQQQNSSKWSFTTHDLGAGRYDEHTSGGGTPANIKCLSAYWQQRTGEVYVVTGHGHRDANVRVWQLSSGKVVKRLTGHRMNVTSVCVNESNGTLVSVSSDEYMRVWDLERLLDTPEKDSGAEPEGESRPKDEHFGIWAARRRNQGFAGTASRGTSAVATWVRADPNMHVWDGASGRHRSVLRIKVAPGASLHKSRKVVICGQGKLAFCVGMFKAGNGHTRGFVRVWCVSRENDHAEELNDVFHGGLDAEVSSAAITSDGMYGAAVFKSTEPKLNSQIVLWQRKKKGLELLQSPDGNALPEGGYAIAAADVLRSCTDASCLILASGTTTNVPSELTSVPADLVGKSERHSLTVSQDGPWRELSATSSSASSTTNRCSCPAHALFDEDVKALPKKNWRCQDMDTLQKESHLFEVGLGSGEHAYMWMEEAEV